jgi:hypothetical protein
MSSKDLERSAAIYELKRRAGASEDRAAHKERSGEPEPKPESEPELIERTLEMEGCCALDRSSIEALEALLTELDPADELRLTLSLGEETPVRLGIALADESRLGKRRDTLTAGLDFATALVNTRRQR